MITLSNIKLNLDKDEGELLKLAQSKLKGDIKHFKIIKKSLDARDKSKIQWTYNIEFSDKVESVLNNEVKLAKVKPFNVAIIGSGPAGLFCAISLIEMGIAPIIIERGSCIEQREKAISRLNKERVLNGECNIQFGEGGAGTFSDGKLNTQTNTPLNKKVFETFVRFGANEEILYLSKPHIGSDVLKKVIVNMRNYISQNGGKILFDTKLFDIEIDNEQIKRISVKNTLTNKVEQIEVSDLVLAIGHSSRDTFKMLKEKGFAMEQKEFAVGVRIEHLQKEISFSQYGKAYESLPPADYKLVSHASERSCFSFCMCPGGFVMGATSEENAVVTNGMSNFARNGRNANSALIVQVKRDDFSSDDVLAGVEFQRKLERKAFELGGKNYNAPIQLMGDFLKDKKSVSLGNVEPTYPVGTSFANLNDLFPQILSSSLKRGIVDMGKRLSAFASVDAVLTGVESRTSSPVRIVRKENLQSASVCGVYPCGEGAGYAGGITSSAVDGIKVADAIFQRYN